MDFLNFGKFGIFQFKINLIFAIHTSIWTHSYVIVVFFKINHPLFCDIPILNVYFFNLAAFKIFVGTALYFITAYVRGLWLFPCHIKSVFSFFQSNIFRCLYFSADSLVQFAFINNSNSVTCLNDIRLVLIPHQFSDYFHFRVLFQYRKNFKGSIWFFHIFYDICGSIFDIHRNWLGIVFHMRIIFWISTDFRIAFGHLYIARRQFCFSVNGDNDCCHCKDKQGW